MGNGTDWRLQTQGSLSKDWKSPWSGEIHPKGTKFTIVSVIQLSKKKNVTVPIPNATASCLNISKRTWDEARAIRKNSNLDRSIKKEVSFKCDEDALNYLESMMQSIVFAFTALEAFVNELIPSEYQYEKKSRRSTETFSKEEIERWISIDEKLGTILPTILSVPSPKGKHKSWEGFVKLKDVRDRLIHMKTDDRKSSGIEEITIWTELVKSEPPYKAALAIIEYFILNGATGPSWFSNGKQNLKK